MSSFKGENILTQYNVLTYRIDLYLHDNKLAIEIDENRHSDRNIDYEMKIQNTTEEELCCKFIRTELTRKTLIFLELSMKYLDTLNNQQKKALINKISTTLLRLEFKSDNLIKSKTMKFIFAKIFPDYK